MRQHLEAVRLDSPGPGPGDSGASSEFRQVDVVRLQDPAVLGAYLRQGLVYSVLQVVAFLLVHPSSSRWYIGVFQSRTETGRGGYICSARIGSINSAGYG